MKHYISWFVLLLLVPAVVVGGSLLFQGKEYAWISLCVAVLSCVPFFLHFEKGRSGVSQMIIIAVMVAISVIGRILFAPIPGFKPVTAIVVITAMYLGGEAGFMTGALSAVISNLYFGQGPWTPFQMMIWGLIGLAAGLLAHPLKRSKWLLAGYGILSGIAFSLGMDIWTTLWMDNYFNWSRYLASVLSTSGFTVVYAISNVLFLLLFEKAIGAKLDRIKTKYGI